MAVAVVLLMAACGNKDSGKPTLMVSIPPQKYLLDRIVGDRWAVECMLEKATSAESYDPEMSQMVKLERCRAYFTVGNLGFERLVADKAGTVVDASKGIATISDGHSHHSSEEADPHVWMSVANMRVMAKNMAEALIDIDNDNKDYYQANYKKLDTELAAFGNSLHKRLKESAGQTFVVWHPALSYLARDYGLRQISVEYEGKEAPIGFIADKIAEAQRRHARVFFIQKGTDSRQASAVCSRIGLRQVEINPLSYEWKREMEHIANELATE